MSTHVNGIDVAHTLSGSDAAPAVMLSHSLGSSAMMWDPQLAALEERYRVIRYDVRGHGSTSAPASAYTLNQLGDDAIGLMDALGISQVHWVGLSMGGMIGQDLALRYPDRLLSLTLCDTMAAIPDEAQPMWQERIDIATAQGMEPLADGTMERWFTEDFRGSDPETVVAIRQQFMNTPAAGFIGCCHAIRRLAYLPDLNRIDLPTLVMVGETDPATPVAASQAMHAAIPQSELVILPKAAHLSNMECVEEFNQRLLTFLAQNNGKP